jgi:hypothetical protein
VAPSQPETPAKKRRGRKPGRKPKVFDLARECGGFSELKILVDRLAALEKK